MKLLTRQSGFSPAEVIIAVVVVAALGFGGYFVYNSQQDKTAGSNTTQQNGTESASAGEVDSAPEINSTQDLEKAQAILDQTDPEESNKSDVGQLDSELAAF